MNLVQRGDVAGFVVNIDLITAMSSTCRAK